MDCYTLVSSRWMRFAGADAKEQALTTVAVVESISATSSFSLFSATALTCVTSITIEDECTLEENRRYARYRVGKMNLALEWGICARSCEIGREEAAGTYDAEKGVCCDSESNRQQRGDVLRCSHGSWDEDGACQATQMTKPSVDSVYRMPDPDRRHKHGQTEWSPLLINPRSQEITN